MKVKHVITNEAVKAEIEEIMSGTVQTSDFRRIKQLIRRYGRARLVDDTFDGIPRVYKARK